MTLRVVASGLVAAAVAVLLVVAGGASAGPSPGEPAEGLYLVDPTSAAPTLLVKGEQDEVSWSPDGRWITALDLNDYAFNVVAPAGGIAHRVDSFAWSNDGSRVAYTPANSGRNPRLLVASSTWSKPRIVTRAPHSDPLAWAPDGRHFVYGTRGADCCYASLVVANASGTGSRPVLKAGGPYLAVWSPSGNQLAAVGYDQYIYVAPAGKGRARRLPGKWGGFPDPVWSPDGKSLFVYPAEGISSTGGFDAVQVSVPSGARKVVCRDCDSFELSPDRKSIAYTDASGALWVESRDGSGKRRIAPQAFEPRWSPDGSRIVFARIAGSEDQAALALVDVATGEIRRLTDGTSIDLPFAGLSPDGRFVAFRRSGETIGNQLWVVGADGTGAHEVMAFGTCSQAEWAPTGALLAITHLDDC